MQLNDEEDDQSFIQNVTGVSKYSAYACIHSYTYALYTVLVNIM